MTSIHQLTIGMLILLTIFLILEILYLNKKKKNTIDFAQYDTNKNGVLSKDEIDNYIRKNKSKRTPEKIISSMTSGAFRGFLMGFVTGGVSGAFTGSVLLCIINPIVSLID